MPYFILVLGLVIIYLALKRDVKSSNNNLFSNVLKDKTDKINLSGVIDRITELEYRIEEIEKSLFVLTEDLNANKEKQIKPVENIEIERNENEYISSNESINIELENNFDEYVPDTPIEQKDVNSIIFELSDSGKSIDDIASFLRMGKGEILLRLGLRKQKK